MRFLFQSQEDSIWLFTAERFEGTRPLTVQASYPGFSEGSNILLSD